MNTKKCFLLETLDKFDKEDISRAYAATAATAEIAATQFSNATQTHHRQWHRH